MPESSFGALTSGRTHWHSSYRHREETRADILAHITMFYDNRRLHSYLGYQGSGYCEKSVRLANAA